MNLSQFSFHSPSEFSTFVRIRIPLAPEQNTSNIRDTSGWGAHNDEDGSYSLCRTRAFARAKRLCEVLMSWSSLGAEGTAAASNSGPAAPCVAWQTSDATFQAVCHKVRSHGGLGGPVPFFTIKAETMTGGVWAKPCGRHQFPSTIRF